MRRAAPSTVRDLRDLADVDLGLLARNGAHPAVDLGLRPPQRAHLQLHALVAGVEVRMLTPEIVVDLHRAEPLVHLRFDPLPERLQLRGHRPSLGLLRARLHTSYVLAHRTHVEPQPASGCRTSAAGRAARRPPGVARAGCVAVARSSMGVREVGISDGECNGCSSVARPLAPFPHGGTAPAGTAGPRHQHLQSAWPDSDVPYLMAEWKGSTGTALGTAAHAPLGLPGPRAPLLRRRE
jgi:hypothetical protein